MTRRKIMSMVRTVLFVTAAASLLFCGCSTSSEFYLRDELANRGPIALSPSNPFVAGNLFVAKEMKHSDIFRGFIKYRGTPDAVEVRTSHFKPIRVYLFYLGEAEAYLMEQGGGDWILRGPDKIPAQLMASFFNVSPAGTHAPLVTDNYEAGLTTGSAEDAPVKSLRPVPEIRSLRKVPPLRSPNNDKTKPVRKQSDDSAQTTENRQVENSASGDVIHRVIYPGETLRIITNWYTGDVNNTGRIARINGIENANVLRIDQTVRIPRYLLKTTKPLPQAEITRMKALDNGAAAPVEAVPDLQSGS